MLIVKGSKLDDLSKFKNGCVALGNFDGVHLAHQELIKQCVAASKQNNLKSIVYTFYPHPEQVLLKGFDGYINSTKIKEKLIADLGVDLLVTLDFNKAIANISPKKFVETFLFESLHPAKIFVGFDYSFGKGGQGNTEELEQLGRLYGFTTTSIAPILKDGLPISSSRIRKYIRTGNIIAAKELLGYHPKYDGVVIQGNHVGKTLGYPTANLKFDKNIILPKPGVYATQVLFNNKRYRAISNIGFRPTYAGATLCFETHILEFSLDIYGKSLEVEIIDRIRDEVKHANANALKKQIALDIETALYMHEQTCVL